MVEVGIMLGENAKACMDPIDFAKYLLSTILPMFPDTADTPGKHIEIIVDSGPGPVNSSILAQKNIRRF